LQPRDLFISRKEELKNLHNCVESIQDGDGKIRFIVGEAGSGKSMLMQEFVRQAQIRDKTLISAIGLCNAFTGIGDPYLPFREILYQLCGDIKHRLKAGIISHDYAIRLWNTIPTICQALISYGPDLIGTIIPSQSLKEFTSPIKASHPALYNKLNVLIDQKLSSQGVSLTQANLFSQFTAVLHEISNDNPLLLVIDDLQWADAGTVSLLFHLGKQLQGANITIIGSYRPEEIIKNKENEQHPLDPVIQELKRIYGDIFIHLDDSSNAQFIKEYISSEPNKLSRTFLESLQKHTGGNPLFTVELIRDLKEIGVLGKDENGFWISKYQIEIDSLPPRIEGIIRERFNRLPKILQRILSIASIEGESFTAEIIAEIENLSNLQTINLLSEQLSKQHNLIKAHQVKLVNGNNLSIYRFRHILIQKFIYNQLDQIELRDLHERVGTTLESVVEENKEEFFVNLARHFQQANIHEKAAGYYFDAGERAVNLSGYLEAINHYRKSIESIQSVPETPKRNQFELNVQLKLGLAYQATRGFANEMVGVAYKRSLKLCQSVQDINKKIITLQLLFSYYSNMAEFETTNEIMTLLEKYTHEMEDPIPSYILQIHWGKGYLESLFGNPLSALEQFEKALDYYEKGPHHQIEENIGMEAGIYCNSWAALHLTWLGFLDRADEHCQIALKIADEKNIKLFTADALWFSTWINLELKYFEKAWEYCHAALDLAIKENYYLTEALVRLFKGRILSNNGNHEEAIDSAKLALQMFQNIGAISSETTFLHGMAEVYCNAGMIDEGLEIIQKSETIIHATGECRHQAALQRIKGNLYLKSGDEFNAEKAYLSSIDIAKNQSAKMLELETAIDLFELWHRQGKSELAKEMLSETFNWFSEGINNPLLIKAQNLLNEY
jgi:tetratricopeptide (TPR) repeat protein